MDDVLTAPDAGDATGAEAAPVPSTEDSGSLADHEASFAPSSEPATAASDETATDRDDRGQFKPRHRAASQRADIDDVPTINAHTKRIKDAEAKLGADIAKQDGESERAFTLRRRAELLERQATAPAAPAAAREPEPPARQPARVERTPDSFPTFDAWIAQEANAAKSFEDFIDARSDWRDDMRQETRRVAEAKSAAQRAERDELDAYVTHVAAFVKDRPDFDAVIAAARPISKVLEVAAIKAGPKVAYYLATHPEEAEALTQETLGVSPDNPAFPASVASMKRYIATLIADEPRPPAAPVRAAAPVLAPRPPNPVRTGPSRADTDVPGDDATIAEHERAFGQRRR